MQPTDPHQHHTRPHEHRAGPPHGIEHRDRVEYNEYATGGPAHRHDHDAPLPPTSPSLSAFHRPTAQPDTAPLLPALRRRVTQQQTEDLLRIAVATPFSDGDRRKERSVPASLTVRAFKDELARDEHDRWDRDSMRLVWRGRIVRDDELLGTVIGEREAGQVHTFHLVARRLGGSRPGLSTRNTATGPLPTLASTSPTNTGVPASAMAVGSTRNAQAIADTLHFTLFLIRHHLCVLLGVAPLAWDDAVPKPTVDQGTAKTAIMSVLRAYVTMQGGRDEAWENWEMAFEDGKDVIWDTGRRGQVVDEIKGIWSERVCRHWRDGPDGEQVEIELDGLPYQLHLPPVDLMTPSQLIHLLLYLRLTKILPLINVIYTMQTLAQALPSPTRTTAPPPALSNIPELPGQRIRQYGLRLQINAASLSHIFFSALKVGAMLWMLTRDMKWDDYRLWIIGGGLLGWWLGDAMNQIRPGLIWNNGAAPAAGAQAGLAPPGGAAQPGPNGDGNIGAAQPGGTPSGAAAAQRARVPPHTGNAMNAMIPLVHLDTDAEQLHLAARRPTSRPYGFVTQLLLPIALWFITLIPEWETLRARAIRQRERAIRVWVGELTTARDAEERARRQVEGDGATAESNGEAAEEAPALPVLPEGLSDKAKRYYLRVIERGDGIDWEEEREAQRAMGIADEDERQADDDGMRMRML